jgi:hypothetical protein
VANLETSLAVHNELGVRKRRASRASPSRTIRCRAITSSSLRETTVDGMLCFLQSLPGLDSP